MIRTDDIFWGLLFINNLHQFDRKKGIDRLHTALFQRCYNVYLSSLSLRLFLFVSYPFRLLSFFGGGAFQSRNSQFSEQWPLTAFLSSSLSFLLLITLRSNLLFSSPSSWIYGSYLTSCHFRAPHFRSTRFFSITWVRHHFNPLPWTSHLARPVRPIQPLPTLPTFRTVLTPVLQRPILLNLLLHPPPTPSPTSFTIPPSPDQA
jgi:hypothetical protein